LIRCGNDYYLSPVHTNSFEQLTTEFQALATKLKVCKDPRERKHLLSEMRSIIGKLDHFTDNTSPLPPDQPQTSPEDASS
jgi:hypothetical protein